MKISKNKLKKIIKKSLSYIFKYIIPILVAEYIKNKL